MHILKWLSKVSRTLNFIFDIYFLLNHRHMMLHIIFEKIKIDPYLIINEYLLVFKNIEVCSLVALNLLDFWTAAFSTGPSSIKCNNYLNCFIMLLSIKGTILFIVVICRYLALGVLILKLLIVTTWQKLANEVQVS